MSKFASPSFQEEDGIAHFSQSPVASSFSQKRVCIKKMELQFRRHSMQCNSINFIYIITDGETWHWRAIIIIIIIALKGVYVSYMNRLGFDLSINELSCAL